MKTLFGLAAEVQGFLEDQGWKFAFIGGLALQRWGEPRLTVDVDLTLLAGFGDEEKFIDELLKRYKGRREDTREFALKTRVLLLQSEDGIGIDISLGALPFEEVLIERATYFEFLPGLKILTCSAEDQVVLKAFADRARDWADLEGILIRQQDRLEWEYINKHLPPLCAAKEAPEILDKLWELKRRINPSG